MADERTIPVRNLQCSSMLNEHQLQRDLLLACIVKVCDAAVTDSPILQRYLDIKHN